MNNHLLSETLLNFSQAAKRLPAHRGPGRCSPATIWRWCRDGIKLPGGAALRLEAVRVAGHWLTSVEALERFVEASTAAHNTEIPFTSQTRTPSQRHRDSERAARQLEEYGI